MHLGDEPRRVIRAAAGNLDVLRQIEALALGPLLQCRLRIGNHVRQLLELRRPQRAHDIAGLIEAGFGENGTEQRLDGIGEDRFLLASAAFGLAIAQDQILAEPDPASHAGAGLPADQPIVPAGEFAFAGLGMRLVQHFSDSKAEHAVADEFEPLVIMAHAALRSDTRMGQRAII